MVVTSVYVGTLYGVFLSNAKYHCTPTGHHRPMYGGVQGRAGNVYYCCSRQANIATICNFFCKLSKNPYLMTAILHGCKDDSGPFQQCSRNFQSFLELCKKQTFLLRTPFPNLKITAPESSGALEMIIGKLRNMIRRNF